MTIYQFDKHQVRPVSQTKARRDAQILQGGDISLAGSNAKLNEYQREQQLKADERTAMKGVDVNSEDGKRQLAAFYRDRGEVEPQMKLQDRSMAVKQKQQNTDLGELTLAQKRVDQVRQQTGAIWDTLSKTDSKTYPQGLALLKSAKIDTSMLPNDFESAKPIIASMGALSTGIAGQLKIDALKQQLENSKQSGANAKIAGETSKYKLGQMKAKNKSAYDQIQKMVQSEAYETVSKIFGKNIGEFDDNQDYDYILNNSVNLIKEGRMGDALKLSQQRVKLGQDSHNLAVKRENRISGNSGETGGTSGSGKLSAADKADAKELDTLISKIAVDENRIDDPGLVIAMKRAAEWMQSNTTRKMSPAEMADIMFQIKKQSPGVTGQAFFSKVQQYLSKFDKSAKSTAPAFGPPAGVQAGNKYQQLNEANAFRGQRPSPVDAQGDIQQDVQRLKGVENVKRRGFMPDTTIGPIK